MTNYLLLALKGCAMGMADVIPGVSGGTIAFISGIYTELIESIDLPEDATLDTSEFFVIYQDIFQSEQ